MLSIFGIGGMFDINFADLPLGIAGICMFLFSFGMAGQIGGWNIFKGSTNKAIVLFAILTILFTVIGANPLGLWST
jgi:membrane protein implicated in regulation of membrane protease activity